MTNITVDDINITMIDNIVITINYKTYVSMDDITLTTITPIGNITNIIHLIIFQLKYITKYHLIILQPMHFFPMAMYTHTLVPPPKEVSTELGETRSAKRGAVI